MLSLTLLLYAAGLLFVVIGGDLCPSLTQPASLNSSSVRYAVVIDHFVGSETTKAQIQFFQHVRCALQSYSNGSFDSIDGWHVNLDSKACDVFRGPDWNSNINGNVDAEEYTRPTSNPRKLCEILEFTASCVSSVYDSSIKLFVLVPLTLQDVIGDCALDKVFHPLQVEISVFWTSGYQPRNTGSTPGVNFVFLGSVHDFRSNVTENWTPDDRMVAALEAAPGNAVSSILARRFEKMSVSRDATTPNSSTTEDFTNTTSLTTDSTSTPLPTSTTSTAATISTASSTVLLHPSQDEIELHADDEDAGAEPMVYVYKQVTTISPDDESFFWHVGNVFDEPENGVFWFFVLIITNLFLIAILVLLVMLIIKLFCKTRRTYDVVSSENGSNSSGSELPVSGSQIQRDEYVALIGAKKSQSPPQYSTDPISPADPHNQDAAVTPLLLTDSNAVADFNSLPHPGPPKVGEVPSLGVVNDMDDVSNSDVTHHHHHRHRKH